METGSQSGDLWRGNKLVLLENYKLSRNPSGARAREKRRDKKKESKDRKERKERKEYEKYSCQILTNKDS